MSNTNFPTSIDSNPGDPAGNETLAAGNHATLHGFANDAIIALETYVGAVGSAVTTSLTYIINHLIPTLSIGAVLYSNESNILSALGIGTSGQVLTISGGLPAWESLPSTNVPSGAVLPFTSTTPPSGWLLCDGTAYSAATYPTLALVLLGTFGVGTGVTGTYAASVITKTSHGLSNGQIIFFSGSVPSGLSANTAYYVVNATTNTFQVSATSGGSAVTIASGGSGSLTYNTNFQVPDLRSRAVVGTGQGSVTATIASIAGNIITATGLTNNANNEFQTGQEVLYTGSGGNLSNATNYYVVRVTNTTFSVATSLANAQNGTVVTLAGTETGSFALTLTSRTITNTGGEENHAISSTEMLAHTHSVPLGNGGSGNPGTTTNTGGSSQEPSTGNFGGNAAMNNMQPFMALPYIIKT